MISESELGQTQERLTDLGAKLTRDQRAAGCRSDAACCEKSVFSVNFQNVGESVDAMQRAIVVVSARSDADGVALL